MKQRMIVVRTPTKDVAFPWDDVASWGPSPTGVLIITRNGLPGRAPDVWQIFASGRWLEAEDVEVEVSAEAAEEFPDASFANAESA